MFTANFQAVALVPLVVMDLAKVECIGRQTSGAFCICSFLF